MSKEYERELKRILQGDIDTLKKATRSCSEEEKEDYFKIKDIPFLVIRSAGSLGVDLVALRGELSFPIEVKSSIYKKIRLASSPRLKEQALKMEKACEKSGLIPLYAFRLKRVRGDSWRIFTLKAKEFKGWRKLIYNRLQSAEVTKNNYYILKWDDGTPLHRFISDLAHIMG